MQRRATNWSRGVDQAEINIFFSRFPLCIHSSTHPSIYQRKNARGQLIPIQSASGPSIRSSLFFGPARNSRSLASSSRRRSDRSWLCHPCSLLDPPVMSPLAPLSFDFLRGVLELCEIT